MTGFDLHAVDTWFFRDGTPFSAGSAPQDDVGSLFPPYPATVAGSIRAALARSNGWSGRGRWPEYLDEVLGDGPDDLGQLSLVGPFLLRDGAPLFPVPRHLLGEESAGRWVPRAILLPGPAVECDLGDAVRLPQIAQTVDDVRNLKDGNGRWLTKTGFEAVLLERLPAEEDLILARELWSEERRIGLLRSCDTRTAKEGMLYSTRHVRLKDNVSIGTFVDGIPDTWALPFDQLFPLGGESRLAEFRKWEGDITIEMPLDEIRESGRFTMTALTPMRIDELICRGQESVDVFGQARVVSGCLSRSLRIGGWNSLTRRPLPLRSVLPPGSVLFCQTASPKALSKALDLISGELPRLGAGQPAGFGLVALGIWNDSEVNA